MRTPGDDDAAAGQDQSRALVLVERVEDHARTSVARAGYRRIYQCRCVGPFRAGRDVQRMQALYWRTVLRGGRHQVHRVRAWLNDWCAGDAVYAGRRVAPRNLIRVSAP